MVKPLIEPGAELDGFTIGECVHQGGMATLWTVTHPGINVPLLMKVPRVAEGEDPAAIVSFEMEQMIVPRLAGPARAGLFRHRRFRPAALRRHGAHPRQDAVQPDRPIAASL